MEPGSQSEKSGASPTRTAPAPAWAEQLVRLLDDGFVLPGTSFRFGFDALLGLFVPGMGDATMAAGAAGLFWLALKRRVPKIVLARMALNVLVDTLVGSVPVLGDAFDFVWRSNRRNLKLVERYRESPHQKPRASDYVIMSLVVLILLVAVSLPFVVAGMAVGWLIHTRR